MKLTRVEPVSPEMERLLAAERDIPKAPAELKARALSRAGAVFHGRNVLSAQRLSPSKRTWLLAAAVAMAFAAVSFAAFLRLGSNESVPVHAAAPRDETGSAAPSVKARGPAVATAPEQQAVPAELSAPKKESRDADPKRSPVDAHAIELGILQRARAAVASAQFSTALGAIAEHQRRFPNGILQEEREALRVKALAGLGKTEEAQKAARRFSEKFPNSVLAPRLEEATQRAP
jgi:TolA-binding protein